MKTCGRCKVTVTGGFSKCPLCQHTLIDDGEEDQFEPFPVIETFYHTHNLFFKILLFSLICVSIIAIMLDFMIPDINFWSLLITIGAGCVWLSVVTAVRRQGAFHKKLLDMAFLVSLLSLLWDFLTGWHKWSIDYVIPIAFICCMLIAVIVAWLLKLPSEQFAVYLLIFGFLGLIPALFLIFQWNRHPLLTFICVTISLLFFAALLVFQSAMVKNEIKRRMHL